MPPPILLPDLDIHLPVFPRAVFALVLASVKEVGGTHLFVATAKATPPTHRTTIITAIEIPATAPGERLGLEADAPPPPPPIVGVGVTEGEAPGEREEVGEGDWEGV